MFDATLDALCSASPTSCALVSWDSPDCEVPATLTATSPNDGARPPACDDLAAIAASRPLLTLPETVARWVEECAPASWQARAAAWRSQPQDVNRAEDAGGMLAQCRVSLSVVQEPEGAFFELRVPLPATRGWGAWQRNELLREQTLVACVRRLSPACSALLERALPLQGLLPVLFAFDAGWDDCLAPLQRMLVREVLAAHLRQPLSGTAD